MSTFIAIDSSYATDIQAASSYREAKIYPYLQSKGFNLSPFFGPLARRGFVAPVAASPGVSLLTGAGHGTYSSFLGFNLEPIYAISGYAAAEVSGKIAHFLSCENAFQLGPDFVRNGCVAYVGYDENFAFDPDFADLFFNCDGEIDRGLADGLSVGDAVGRSKNLFAQTIADLNASGNTRAASILTVNLTHLRSPLDGPQWGDSDAKLPS
jgi:hypothetical protein